jgi:chemotaxis protein CheD
VSGDAAAESRPAPARVGIGQLRVAEPPETLAVYGIGSCVVVFVHDGAGRRGALAHPLLPGEPPRRLPPAARGKYAPSAIRALAAELRGPSRRSPPLEAKVVGGAAMFQVNGDDPLKSIGRRNLEAVLEALQEVDIPVVGQETGGAAGRSLIADPATGRLEVWTLRTDIRIL